MTQSMMRLLFLATLLAATTSLSWAGPDDDAPFKSDGKTRNAKDPVYGGGKLADFPMNAEAESGLRILPPTGTELFVGQRFDLRVETQIPAESAVILKWLSINGKDVMNVFGQRVTKQGSGAESGTPQSPLLFGMTARNMAFDKPGLYRVDAVVTIDGIDRRISNQYDVARAPNPNAPGAARKVVFFLGDGMGLPMRTAARIMSKGIFEGRAREMLAMEKMSYQGISMTTSFDSIITDSAPGMATLMSGMKQSNNALQVSVDNTPENPLDNPRIETIFEYMKRVHGWKIGVVTDAFLTDATPAAVQAHHRSRRDYETIAQQMIGYYADDTKMKKTGYAALATLSQPLDVLLGGGATQWMAEDNPDLKSFYQVSRGGRKDVDLMKNIAPSLGYSVVRNFIELNTAPNNRKLLGIFTGEFRKGSSGLGADNLPGVMDRLLARGQLKIRGKGPNDTETGMSDTPPGGKGCGGTVAECFLQVPSKLELAEKAIDVLETLGGTNGGWMLLVEQSQTDKFGHILEYERAAYEVIELDNTIAGVRKKLAKARNALMVVTADHAQPQTIIGVAMPSVLAGAAGSCFQTTDGGYPISLGSGADRERPCSLQDAIGTFNDATFPTYEDLNGDGFPDDPDPTIKLVIEDGGRPTYSTTYQTNYMPLKPSATVKDEKGASLERPAIPNPGRQPEGLLMTGNMPTRNISGGANKTSGAVDMAPHTADDVLVSAQGAGAHFFAGFYENSSVHIRLAKAMGAPAITAHAVARGGNLVGW